MGVAGIACAAGAAHLRLVRAAPEPEPAEENVTET